MKNIKKYIGLFFSIMRMSWMVSAEYRVNFLAWVLVDIVWAVIDLLYLSIIVTNMQSIGSWTQPHVLILVGVFRLLCVVIWGWMDASFNKLPEMVRRGDLDLLLTKPVNSQFMVSFRDYSMNLLASLVIGAALVVKGVFELGLRLPVLQVAWFLWLMCISTVLIYGIFFSIVAICIYVEKLENITFVFTTMFDLSRFPREIYGIAFQGLITLILPIGLMVQVPAESLFMPPSLATIIWFHVSAVFFFCLSRVVWEQGLKRYASASS